jgi:hypothetical protein
VPVTNVERTITDLLRTTGWTEQIELAVQQPLRRGLTTPRKLRAALPAKWQSRLNLALERATALGTRRRPLFARRSRRASMPRARIPSASRACKLAT